MSVQIALRHARSRLRSISSAEDAWAFLVRTANFLLTSTGRESEKLKAYDMELTGKFAYRKLAKYQVGEKYNFNGIYLPSLDREDYGNLTELYACVKDVLSVYLHNNDDYSKAYVDKLDKYLVEGVYCYEDENAKILISEGDTVLDLGAWIGDFSAYAGKKGARVYAFEPMEATRHILEQTVQLNSNSEIKIVPFGVGDKNEVVEFYHYKGHTASSTFSAINANITNSVVKQQIVRLDDWIISENVKKVDFIKADIEGFEPNMLRGATNILKYHKPILSLCTYHNPTDFQEMRQIILAANEEYKIIRRFMKMFAY
ncbi:MAG: FkbM family methyltransferase [Turicibacter sp.]|nr:FkbM family methyltransferase [Turicibacter sp.]